MQTILACPIHKLKFFTTYNSADLVRTRVTEKGIICAAKKIIYVYKFYYKSYTHIHKHTHINTLYTYMYTQTHTHKHTIHIHTDTNTHTHRRTHTHILEVGHPGTSTLQHRHCRRRRGITVHYRYGSRSFFSIFLLQADCIRHLNL